LKEVDVTVAKKAAATPKKAIRAPKATPAAKSTGSSTKKAAKKEAAPAAKVTAKKSAKKTAVSTTKSTPKKATTAKRAAPAPAPPKKAAVAKQVAPAKKAVVAKKATPAPPAPKRPTVGPYAKEPKFLQEQRELLLEERGVYDGQAHDLRAEADSLALEREPGDVQFDEESGEGGTVTVDRERNLALSAQASAAVEEIDDALRKVERTTYGGCERCHQPIPKARLRALPFARLCVACKSGGLSRR
jgi:DnaK suppressor protein